MLKRLREILSGIYFLKRLHYRYCVKHSPSRLRREGNLYFRQVGKDIKGRVLNIGAGWDLDKMGDFYRSYFKRASEYVTMDSGDEPVDLISDIRNMPEIKDESFDAVFCIWVLEHVDEVELAVKEISRILKPEGTLIFGLPLSLNYHGFPYDYWRFSLEGIPRLLDPHFSIKSAQSVGVVRRFEIDDRLRFYGPKCELGPEGYVGLAQKKIAT